MVEKAGGADLDVSDWLSQADAVEEEVAPTRRNASRPGGPKRSEDDDKLPTKTDKKAGLFGQEAPKQTSADSRSAAADLLNKMLGQKKR